MATANSLTCIRHRLDASALDVGLAAVSMVWGGLLFAYILRRVGKLRALAEDELATLGRSPDPNQVRMKWAGGRGAKLEATASISSLRQAAQRGDWGLFWAWPCFMLSWGGGMALLFLGMFASDADTPTVIYVTLGIFFIPFLGIPLFMAWAALYTNLEMDVDEPDEGSAPEES